MSGLGQRLKKEREMRGVSLDEIAKATRINKKFLAALEEDDFDALPAPVFVTGFLRSYAMHLGMDADGLMAEFEKNKKTGKSAQTPDPEKSHQPLLSKDEINRNFPLAATVVGILLVVGLLAIFVTRSSPPQEPATQQKPEEEDLLNQPGEPAPPPPLAETESFPAETPPHGEPSAAKPVDQAGAKPTEQPAVQKAEPAKPAPKPVEVPAASKPEHAKPAEATAEPASSEKLKTDAASPAAPKPTYKYSIGLTAAEQDVWVYVVIDDGEVRDMYVRAGQTVFLRGNEKFILTTGNSFYLKLKVNGIPVEIPSASTNKVIRNWPIPLPE